MLGQPELPPPDPPRTLYELERDLLIEELAETAPTAEATGAKVILEPQNASGRRPTPVMYG
jgi:sugar phosphate isomerase/epimerase